MRRMQRFVVCGEALIDLVRDDRSPRDTFSSVWEAQSAGGPMNTAIALARQGDEVAFLGRLSSDPFGEQLRDHLTSNGVSLDLVVPAREATSLAIVSLDASGKASYHFHLAGTANFEWAAADLPPLTDDTWLHLGSLVAVVQPGRERLLRYIRSTGAALSYDLNVRPSVLPDPVAYWNAVEPWMEAVGHSGGIVRGSDDDIAFLAGGLEITGSAVEVASLWAEQYQPALFLVTLGAGGAVAIKPDGRTYAVAAPSVRVVDTVGAGDTFMAGFLHSYVTDPDDVEAALRRGTAAAALVCERRGADAPSTVEIDALLSEGR